MDWGKWHGHAPTPGSTILATRISSSLVDMASMSAPSEWAKGDHRAHDLDARGESKGLLSRAALLHAAVGLRPGSRPLFCSSSQTEANAHLLGHIPAPELLLRTIFSRREQCQ